MEKLRVEVVEAGRRFKRLTDGHMTRRRILIIILFFIFFFLYLGPGIIRWLWYSEDAELSDPQAMCMYDRLTPFHKAHSEQNVYIKNDEQPVSEDNTYVPYVGNGVFGLTTESDAFINIKNGRTLSLDVNFHPIVSVDDGQLKETMVVDYLYGLVHRFQCSARGYNVVYRYYAHRTIPSLFVQEIRISNPTNSQIDLKLTPTRISDWPTVVKQNIKLHHGLAVYDYDVFTGMIEIGQSNNMVVAVSIVSRVLPSSVTLDSKASVTFNAYTTIVYSDPISRDRYVEQKDIMEKNAIAAMERVIKVSETENKLKDLQAYVWLNLWYTGFSLSESKAQAAINGDKINATIYAVLSQVRSLEYEEGISNQKKSEIVRSLTYAEGCYEGHYTLQANNLWKPLDNLYQMNTVVGAWLLTLEKQGCHNLLKAGASGVIQAMVLSFGGLRFSNQHLEFNIHPSSLHRDFFFRRLNYGNMTHVNISVVLQEDNKAAMYVALDRSDRTYYACDGGCMDSPIQLGPARKYFPVKLTDPLTAILYITSDKQHMEDLRHAIHVKEVALAPAHEHHVIALHKHGHSLGGLPTIFWVSICILIVVFHLFLCRIIVTEFCDPPDKYRRVYSKP